MLGSELYKVGALPAGPLVNPGLAARPKPITVTLEFFEEEPSTMKTKKQRLEEQALAREAIRRATTMPGILLIDWVSGRPTSTGRTDRYQIRYISLNSEGPEVWFLTYSVARALGYRLNSDGHVSISGYGYSKSHGLAHAITAIAQKDLRVHADQTERVVKYDPTSHRAA